MPVKDRNAEIMGPGDLLYSLRLPLCPMGLIWFGMLWFLIAVPACFAMPNPPSEARPDEVHHGKTHASILEVYNRLHVAAPVPASNQPAPCRLSFTFSDAMVSTRPPVVLTLRQTAWNAPMPIPVAVSFRYDRRAALSFSGIELKCRPYEPACPRGEAGIKLMPLVFEQRQAIKEVQVVCSLTDAKTFAIERMPFELALNSDRMPVHAESILLRDPEKLIPLSADIPHVLFHSGALPVQPRQIIFASNLAKTSARSPSTLTLRRPDLTIQQAIDQMMISRIIDEVRSGRINKRNPEIRAQLVQFLGGNPLGPTSQQVFSMILDNFPGNNLRRKIAALQAWAQEYAGGRYAPLLGYHIMHQFYRNKDYDAAIQFAESFLEKTKEFNDRVCFLQALCYAQKKNTAAALDVLQKIKRDFPESPMAPESVFLYAWISYEDGNLAEAQTILKELVAKYPNSASAAKAANLLEAINQKNSLAASKP